MLTSLCRPLSTSAPVQIRPPSVQPAAPLQLLCANIDYDEHKGRIAIGRVSSGTIKRGQTISICSSLEPGKVRWKPAPEGHLSGHIATFDLGGIAKMLFALTACLAFPNPFWPAGAPGQDR